jgi:oligoribonuclease (3'-5' exoribonuclease)
MGKKKSRKEQNRKQMDALRKKMSIYPQAAEIKAAKESGLFERIKAGTMTEADMELYRKVVDGVQTFIRELEKKPKRG